LIKRLWKFVKKQCLYSHYYLFSAPYKIGFAKNSIFGLLAVIFAEIPADSIWLSANRAGISTQNCENFAQNMQNGSKSLSLNPEIEGAENR
jgi:hypothetical protein